MANKRILKKEINGITTILLTECLLNQYTHVGEEAAKYNALANQVIDMQCEFLSRVNVTDGRNNPKLVKKYYQQLIADFDAALGEVLDQLPQA